MIGAEWGEFPNNYCIQLARAPKETPQQNGLAERLVRSLKIAMGKLLLDMSLRPTHALLTLVTMTRNHVPRTVTGIPPAMATTGRIDLLSLRAAAAWNRDPQSSDPVARQMNSMRNILKPRNAIVTAGARRELATCAHRNLPDGSREFAPVGSSVQIELRVERVGSYRVVGQSRSNITAENGRKVLSGINTKSFSWRRNQKKAKNKSNCPLLRAANQKQKWSTHVRRQ